MHQLGHHAPLGVPAGDQGDVGGSSPGDLHRHRPPGAAGTEHHNPLPPQGRDLLDRFDAPLAVVMADQAARLEGDVVGGIGAAIARARSCSEAMSFFQNCQVSP